MIIYILKITISPLIYFLHINSDLYSAYSADCHMIIYILQIAPVLQPVRTGVWQAWQARYEAGRLHPVFRHAQDLDRQVPTEGY